ncbi:hypothetical protein RISK_005796 [Rhodopirellula islandica]|uniref:Uncharacterized protein n=1 Tax=Rhodopirellula islandica TaxID=595434 RepID=A0A0J1B6L9_RHOIS|nr:hypothetical protein RISK_005796 [Rhodopirellula islandica]
MVTITALENGTRPTIRNADGSVSDGNRSGLKQFVCKSRFFWLR